MNLQWIIEQNKIALYDNDTFIYTDSGSIWKSVFSSQPVVIGTSQAPDISLALPDLEYSKQLASPCLSLDRNVDGNLIVNISVQVNSKPYAIADDADQIIVNNKWFAINRDFTEEIRDTLVDLSIPFHSPINFAQIAQLNLLQGIDVLEGSDKSEINEKQKLGHKYESIPGLKASLYPYQKDGVVFLHAISDQNIGSILGDEMGLGKTLQIIALLQYEKNKKLEPKNGKSLIVVPATLMENWYREIAKFAPKLSVLKHYGAKRTGLAEGFDDYDVVIVSYETCVNDASLFNSFVWNLVVLDEAQNIKNPDAIRTQIVKALPRRVSIAVTGTPVENHLRDLWSLTDFAVPNLLGSLRDFEALYSNETQYNATTIGNLVSPILLRRAIKDVAKDLPQRIDIPQPLEMTAILASAYEQERQNIIDTYGQSASLVQMIKLRQLCTHPSLVMAEWNEDPAYGMPKYQRAMELLEEIFLKNEKALVVTSFVPMSAIFIQDLMQQWPKAYLNRINGDVDIKMRQPIVDEFSQFEGYGALFINPQAGGTGLNIPTANHVIHYNPEWNPALTDQASARSYRRGQEKPVTIHYLYFVDTIEEYVVDTVLFKRNLARTAVKQNDHILDNSEIIKLGLSVSPIKE